MTTQRGDAVPTPIATPDAVVAQSGNTRWDVIVVKRGADLRAVARGVGAAPRYLYEHVIEGVAASLLPQAIRGLEHNSAVIAVVPDRQVEALPVTAPGAARNAAAAPRTPRAWKKITTSRSDSVASRRQRSTIGHQGPHRLP